MKRGINVGFPKNMINSINLSIKLILFLPFVQVFCNKISPVFFRRITSATQKTWFRRITEMEIKMSRQIESTLFQTCPFIIDQHNLMSILIRSISYQNVAGVEVIMCVNKRTLGVFAVL